MENIKETTVFSQLEYYWECPYCEEINEYDGGGISYCKHCEADVNVLHR